MSNKKLPTMQARFVSEYLIDLNATQAAIRAGYSEKTAYSQGQRLLKNVEIAKLIAKAQKNVAERNDITVDSIVQELALIGFSNMADYMTVKDGMPTLDFTNLTRSQAAVLTEVTVDTRYEGTNRDGDLAMVDKVKFKLADKRAALVDLGKHLGMFTKKLELSGPEGEPLQIRDDERVKKLQAIINRAQARKKAEAKKK